MNYHHEILPLEFGEPQPEPRIEYELLKGHDRSDGSYKSTEQLKTEYVKLSDELIRKATEGIEVIDRETGEVSLKKPDYIVWLDKSARPVSWLVHDLWSVLAQDEHGEIPQMPETRFVNIDRNQWASKVDSEGRGQTEVDALDQSIIRSLRSIFLSNPSDREGGLSEHIDDAPAQLDGKTVMIVDELRTTGRTLDYAKRFFERAFPTANVAGAYWMGSVITVKGAVVNADAPIWYSDNTELGRGIGNRNEDKSLKSKNSTQRLGAWFLSTRLIVPDPMSRQLRQEIRQLAQDTADGTIFVEPSIHREDADYEERALRLNRLDSFKDYVAQKRRFDAPVKRGQ